MEESLRTIRQRRRRVKGSKRGSVLRQNRRGNLFSSPRSQTWLTLFGNWSRACFSVFFFFPFSPSKGGGATTCLPASFLHERRVIMLVKCATTRVVDATMGVKILLDIAGGYLGSILSHTSVTRVLLWLRDNIAVVDEGGSDDVVRFEQVTSSWTNERENREEIIENNSVLFLLQFRENLEFSRARSMIQII